MCLYRLPHKATARNSLATFSAQPFQAVPVGGIFYDDAFSGLWLQKLDDANAAFLDDDGQPDSLTCQFAPDEPVTFSD